jgi:hypothetical protein
MCASVAQFAPVVVVASVCLAISSAVLPDSVARAAPECLAKPSAPPPQGKHWYYHTDRVNKRRCWYLASKGQGARPDAMRAAPAQRPAARPVPTAPAPATPQRTIGDLVRDLNAEPSATSTIRGALSEERAPEQSIPPGALDRAPTSIRGALSEERAPEQSHPSGALDRAPTSTGEAASDDKADSREHQAAAPWPALAAAEPVTGEHPVPITTQPAIEQPAATREQPAPAQEQPPATGSSWYRIMFFAGLFGFVGVLGLVAYRRAAARQRDRLELERRLAASSDTFAATGAQSTFATEVGHWTDIARRQPMPSDDRFKETEDAVRSLVRAARVRHEHAA